MKKHIYAWFLYVIVLWIFYLIYINNTAHNIIFMDQIRLVVNILGSFYEGNLDLKTMFASSAGHRSLFYHTYFLLNALLFDLNVILDVNISAILLLLIAFIFIGIVSKDSNLSTKKKYLVVFMSIFILFSFNKWEIILIGLSLDLVALLSSCVLMLYFLSKSFYENKFFTKSTLLLGVINILFFSPGYFLIYLLSNIISLIIFFIFSLTKNKIIIKQYIKIYIFLIVAVVVFEIFSNYFFNISSGASRSNKFSIIQIISFYINGLAGSIYGVESYFSLGNYEILIPIVGWVVFIINLIICIYILKQKNKNESIFFMVLFIYGNLLLLILSYARSGYGEYATMSSRYALSTMFIPISIGYYAVRLSSLKYSKLHLVYPVILIGCFIKTNIDEIDKAKFRKYYYVALEHQIIDGDDFKGFQSQENLTEQAVKIIRQHQLNVFAKKETQ